MKILFLMGPLLLGYLLDFLLGDPTWLVHPVRIIGGCITGFERMLRRVFPETPGGQRAAGIVLASLLPLLFLAVTAAVLLLAAWINPWIWFALESILCYQLLAVKDLRVESMAVYAPLAAGDLPVARSMVARIVGRDTDALDEAGVARATVETVAENTGDGVVAPLFYMAFGGAALGIWYKSVNTLDSMVGYKNARYLHFGRASALLDDAANFIPARLAAGLMICMSGITGFSSKNARAIYRRDKRNHPSPNSAHTEAACAGALGIQLGGDTIYGGIAHKKLTIGDSTRPVVSEDIPRVNRLMSFTALLTLGVCCVLRVLLLVILL